MPTNTKYNLVAENRHSTVVAEYEPDAKYRAKSYQSEEELERAFIEQLEDQAYDYLTVKTENDLIANLRAQLEKLNGMEFSDSEWEQFFKTEIANTTHGIEDKTATIQEDHVKILKRDDGLIKNIRLIDKNNIHNNALQVINQYASDEGQRPNRYDVTVLVNGLPLVHLELKRRGVAIKEAFNQINRYQRESFWAGSGLYEYVQVFVISNGTNTKYYSNTTRHQHIDEARRREKRGKRSSDSFEFTSWWADARNKQIADLMDFAKTFFAKRTLLNVLINYCVFTSDKQLLVMRPYQIAATEKILNKIEISTNYRLAGKIDAGGYIWHTTGSGKTLTSFKVAQLASELPDIKKVLFVVDRKDLDYQTMAEYDKFEKGAANSNVSTEVLARQLRDYKSRIIITTIQKLARFIAGNRRDSVFHGKFVLIFDECHRSQFGAMHRAITKTFKNYHLFGFTGTPIFAANAFAGGRPDLKTTEQAFGEKLHTYTIVDAINDKNVLPFKVDYVSTVREAEQIDDIQVTGIDREAALKSPERIKNVVDYIRQHFDRKTKRSSSYKLKERRMKGFNSIFTVSSIDMAKLYYAEFKRQLDGVPNDRKLKVALIYSFGMNDEEMDGMADENPEDTDKLDASSRDFLDGAITDYNKMFGTSYGTSSEKFQNYYKDISKRTKEREIDILIVVNMFLTGFDATTLNTLWVDKSLRLHGLLQAYSRTNRILNSVKTFGNIVCFRKLEEATNKSIALFGDEEARGIVLLKSYYDYYNGYTDGTKEVIGYKSWIEDLLRRFPLDKPIIGEQNKKEFVRLIGAILRIRNILETFDEFVGNEILSERDWQDYRGRYLDLYEEFRKGRDGDKENINDDLVFEMELIKQVEINIDFILNLIRKYHEKHIGDREMLEDINKAIDSSVELRNKKDLINEFIKTLDPHSVVDDDWQNFVEEKKIEELDRIIQSENLNRDATYRFVQNAFRDGNVETTGTAITGVLPPISRFSASGELGVKRENVLGKLKNFFERFFDIVKKEFGL